MDRNYCADTNLYTVNDLIDAPGVQLILGVQEGAFNR